jgi:hypothetical protein
LNAADPSARAGRVRPVKLAHFVIRTSRYREMVRWYEQLLEADVLTPTRTMSSCKSTTSLHGKR